MLLRRLLPSPLPPLAELAGMFGVPLRLDLVWWQGQTLGSSPAEVHQRCFMALVEHAGQEPGRDRSPWPRDGVRHVQIGQVKPRTRSKVAWYWLKQCADRHKCDRRTLLSPREIGLLSDCQWKAYPLIFVQAG